MTQNETTAVIPYPGRVSSEDTGVNTTMPQAVTAVDLKQIAVVDQVHGYLLDRTCETIVDAVKKAEVSRSTFYRALENPYVQQQKHAEIIARFDAIHTLLQQYWFHVVKTQIAIASNQLSPREAVQAANFLHRLSQESIEEVRALEEPEGQTDASRFLTEFKAKSKKVTARRTVTEEVEYEP